MVSESLKQLVNKHEPDDDLANHVQIGEITYVGPNDTSRIKYSRNITFY